LYSYGPSNDWIIKDTPKPNEKLNNCPEKTPAIAVLGLPFLAK
jgi:hypothetical protein